MSTRFSKKRINQGRIELFDSDQSIWVALAMVPVAERQGLDDLEMEASQDDLSTAGTAQSRAEAILTATASASASQPRSRTMGRWIGLAIGLALVAVVVLLSR